MNNGEFVTTDEFIAEIKDINNEELKTSLADRDNPKTICNGISGVSEVLEDIKDVEEINEDKDKKQEENEKSEEDKATDTDDDPGVITELNYQEHSIETMKDQNKFEIRGLVATKSPGNIMACDRANHCIKYVDRQFNVVNRYPVIYEPWGVAVVDDTYVVVTFPFVRLMQYLKFKTKSRLVPWFPVKSQNEYYGVCADRDKIIATCRYNEETASRVPSIHVLDREGNIDLVIDKNGKGENIFVDPDYIALNASTQVIYVSDVGSKEVISLGLSGTILARFAVTQFEPRGVTVDDSNGDVFVSYQDSVIHLTRDLRRIQTIKSKEDSMHDVVAITFCSHTDRLIVNMDGSPYFRVLII